MLKWRQVAAAIELTAPDISCEKCKANIEGDLASEPGVG